MRDDRGESSVQNARGSQPAGGRTRLGFMRLLHLIGAFKGMTIALASPSALRED